MNFFDPKKRLKVKFVSEPAMDTGGLVVSERKFALQVKERFATPTFLLGPICSIRKVGCVQGLHIMLDEPEGSSHPKKFISSRVLHRFKCFKSR